MSSVLAMYGIYASEQSVQAMKGFVKSIYTAFRRQVQKASLCPAHCRVELHETPVLCAFYLGFRLPATALYRRSLSLQILLIMK